MEICMHTYTLNTKSFLSNLRELKYWSPDFRFQNPIVNSRATFEERKNWELIYMFAFHNLFGISGQVLLVIISFYKKVEVLYVKPILRNRAINIKLNYLKCAYFCLSYPQFKFWNCGLRVQYLGFNKSHRKVFVFKI